MAAPAPITSVIDVYSKEHAAQTNDATTTTATSIDLKVASAVGASLSTRIGFSTAHIPSDEDQKTKNALNLLSNTDSAQIHTATAVTLIAQEHSIQPPSLDTDTQIDTKRMHADRIIHEIFPMQGYFPVCLSWEFSVYKLLSNHIPHEVNNWLQILKELKNQHIYGVFSEITPIEMYIDITTRSQEKYLKLLNQLHASCIEKLSKQPKIQDLLALLEMRVIFLDDHTIPLPNIEFKTQKEYSQVLEIMGFVDQFCRLSSGAQSIIEKSSFKYPPQLNWQKFFPKKLTDLDSHRSACIREMNISYSYIKMLAYNWRAKTILDLQQSDLELVCVDASNRSVPLNKMPMGIPQELPTACTLTTFENLYLSLYSILLPNIADDELFGQKALKGLSSKIAKVAVNANKETLTIDPINTKLASELIKKFALENKWGNSLLGPITILFTKLEKLLMLQPYILIKFPNTITLNQALRTACPHLTFQCFQSELKNLAFTVRKLDGIKIEVLALMKESLKSIPKDELEKHLLTITACIKELHIIAAKPIVDALEMLFGLARVVGEDQFIPTVETNIIPSNGIEGHVVNFLSLLGLEKLLKQLKKQSGQSIETNGKVAFDSNMEHEFAKLPPLNPSGTSFEDLSATAAGSGHKKARTRKEKRNAAKAGSQGILKKASTSSSAASTISAAGVTATAAVEESEKESYEALPTNMAELKDLLERYGYSLLREGNRHSIYKAPGKTPIPIPRHNVGDAKGTMAAIRKQIFEK